MFNRNFVFRSQVLKRETGSNHGDFSGRRFEAENGDRGVGNATEREKRKVKMCRELARYKEDEVNRTDFYVLYQSRLQGVQPSLLLSCFENSNRS